MARYLIGNSNDTWNFYQAYEACSPGDTLELKENFHLILEDGFFKIDKDLTLEGHVNFENNTNYYTNKIVGKLNIKNKANVNINNLWLESNNKFDNILNIEDSSTVSLNKVIINRTDLIKIDSNQDKYPEVYISDNSSVKFENVSSFDKEDFFSKLFAKNSNIEINNSNLCFSLSFDYSNVNINKSCIKKYYTNAINAKNSDLKISNSTINGGDSEKNYPCLHISKSNINSNNNLFIQKNYLSCLFLYDNSYLISNDDKISSVDLNSSRAFISNLIVNEIFSISQKSLAIIKDSFNLMGENNEKIDLLIGDNSILKADEISLNRTFNPNIRMSGDSTLLTKYLSLDGEYYYDDEDSPINFEKSDDSYYKIGLIENDDMGEE
ncbi:MAG: hypothetical protein E6046_32205, partial [Pseudomonas aeruginosa]|nr:hypothetical protein [Pseudomonas aeruginosa]